MNPTLLDIARETKTSVSTVSRVLAGGSAAQRISEATRARVIDAAQRMGYRPNLIARSLRTRRSNTVALLLSDIGNPFFGALGSLIEQSLHRHGYSLMLCNSNEDPQIEAEYLRLLPQKGIDGLILVPVTRARKQLADFLPPKLPLVLLDRLIPGVPGGVVSDQDQASNMLCDILQRAGVHRAALVSGPLQIATHRRRSEIVSQRFNIIARHEGPAQKDTGRQAFIKFLGLKPDAFICTNNFLGQGIIDSIAQIDNPPIIAAYDEIPMMHLLPLPIVCVLQDIPLMAEKCVEQMMAQLQGREVPSEPDMLSVRAVTNVEFQKRQFAAK